MWQCVPNFDNVTRQTEFHHPTQTNSASFGSSAWISVVVCNLVLMMIHHLPRPHVSLTIIKEQSDSLGINMCSMLEKMRLACFLFLFPPHTSVPCLFSPSANFVLWPGRGKASCGRYSNTPSPRWRSNANLCVTKRPSLSPRNVRIPSHGMLVSTQTK